MRSTPPAQPKVLLPTLLACLWPWFLAWSLLALVVLPANVYEAEVAKWTSHAALGAILSWVVRYFDAIWYLLAIITLYQFVISREGLRAARTWVALLLPILVLRLGVPFGTIYYTGKLGWRSGDLPPGSVLLLWLTLMLLANYASMALLPRAGRTARAALGAGIFVAAAQLLEQVAWKVRFYWSWPSTSQEIAAWPPLMTIPFWFVFAWVVLRFMPSRSVRENERFARPLTILGILCSVWLVTRLVNL